MSHVTIIELYRDVCMIGQSVVHIKLIEYLIKLTVGTITTSCKEGHETILVSFTLGV